MVQTIKIAALSNSIEVIGYARLGGIDVVGMRCKLGINT